MTKKHTTLIIAALFMAAAVSFGCSDSGTGDDQTLKYSIGAEGGACKEDGTCNSSGLSCNEETKTCLKVIVTCEGGDICPVGYECINDKCVAKDTTVCAPACSAGQECKDNKCVAVGPKAGEDGGACLAEDKCSSDELECKNNICSTKPCPVGMVLIKGGKFQMGSDKVTINGTTTDCSKAGQFCSDEYPQHDVTVSDFCMDENEFTNGDRKTLTATAAFTGFIWPDVYSDTTFNTDTQPLIWVKWTEAKAICEKQGKSLPTEAEWEYTARGGTKAEYGIKDGVAPTKDNACWSCENNACKKSTTCNVKSYSPNAFGLYDMSGNVWEWVEDYYNAYPGAGETYWKDIKKDTYRVLRGGSWGLTDPVNLRAADRYNNEPDVRGGSIGFRCVSAPQDSTE